MLKYQNFQFDSPIKQNSEKIKNNLVGKLRYISTNSGFNKETLSSQIANIIKENIIQRNLKPGERIDVKSLSKQFQISQIPVREALKKLESEGFVESRSYKGFFVCAYTNQDLKNIGEARLMVETYCLSTHFENIDRNILQRIYNLMQQSDKEQLEEYIQKDFELHNLIVSASNNPFIIDFYKSLREKIFFFVSIQKDFETCRNQHIEIIESIIKKDKEQAVKALKNHILYATDIAIE